ncbi:MAG: hypothetical protein WB586_21940 [Chthoniobacterales bacterium]
MKREGIDDCTAQPGGDPSPLDLAALESFYIGGAVHEVTISVFGRQTQVYGQMYVERVLSAKRSFPVPVVFIHGVMLTGATWGTTPA